MMTDDEIIAVVKAHKEGKEIEGRSFEDREWFSAIPTWNFEVCEYRVKPEPLVCWVVRYDDGSIGYAVYATEKHAQDVAISNQGVAVKMVEADEND
jgi:hypothetical protein